MKNLRESIQKAWPDWEITKELGSSAYGAVFEAKHEKKFMETEYAAIKAIRLPRDEGEVDRLLRAGLTPEQARSYFEQAAKKCADQLAAIKRIRHCKNIVGLDDCAVTEEDGGAVKCVLVRMELLVPLRQYITVHHFGEEELVKLGIELCLALEICRMHGIVHWDIKPENVLVDQDGNFKLGDFGIASNLKMQELNLSMNGASSVMAPEAVTAGLNSLILNNASLVDVYSLGMLLYWCANQGKLPFKAIDSPLLEKSPPETSAGQSGADALPPLPQISAGLHAVIKKACDIRPENRYPSAAEFRKALEALNAKAAPKGRERTDMDTLSQTVGKTGFGNNTRTQGALSADDLNKTIAEDSVFSDSFTQADPFAMTEPENRTLPAGRKETVKKKRKSDPEPFRYNNDESSMPLNVPLEPPRKSPFIIVSAVMLALAAVIFVIWLVWHQSNPIEEEGTDTIVSASETDAGTAESTSDTTALSSVTAEPGTPSTMITGDVNGDGVVNVLDIIRLQKYLSVDSVVIDMDNSDVTGDGKVNTIDVVHLQKTISGWGSNE